MKEKSPRVALIPAAGRGRRLDRIETPKPLVELGGEAMILRNIRQLRECGIRRFVVVVGHRGDEVERMLFKHPQLEDLEVECIRNPGWERGLVESLLCAREAIGDHTFAIAMADHVFETKTVARLLAFTPEDAVVSVLGDSNFDPRIEKLSPVLMRCEGSHVTEIGRNLPDADVADVGLFKATPELFDALESASRRGGTDLGEAIQLLADDRKVSWLDTDGAAWFDVDTPSELIYAERHLRQRKRRSAASPKVRSEPEDSYAFSTGQPSKTEIILQRGFVRHPQDLAFIPPESASSPIYVFTDPLVDEIYGAGFIGGLEAEGYDVHRVVLPHGEKAKTLETFTHCADLVINQGIDERSILISLGGGTVCNVCGFVASTLYRGIGLIHVPTTVMAQCDAAISHKQAVNASRGKNMVGSYYAPKRIVVDVDVLATLEDWLVPDGLAEVIKHGLAQDADLLEYLLGHDGPVGDPDFLERVIRRNIELKCSLVSRDPHEKREGLVLHYGHTVGHAVEYLSSFELGHGHCVAIGMMAAARVGRLMGCSSDRVVDVHEQVLEHFGLPTKIPSRIEPDAIVEMMRYNKRYLVEGTRFALVADIGRLHRVEDDYAIPVPHQLLREALTDMY